MTTQKFNLRKLVGLVMLAVVVLYWIAIPIIPFLDIPYKAAIIGGLVVGGEILFVLTIAVLGAEYWGRIKLGLRRLFKRANPAGPVAPPQDRRASSDRE